MGTILIIDDDKSLCYSLRRVLEDNYTIEVSNNSHEAFDLLRNHDVHLILLDYKLGSENGLDVLERLKLEMGEIPVVMMTAFGSNEVVLRSIELGAEDYLIKPIKPDELEQVISKFALPSTDVRSQDFYEIEPSTDRNNRFIGYSKPISHVLRTVAQVAQTEVPVLITGESGTGKELIASMIHQRSSRKNAPFIALNCAAIPENLLESELFGYTRGAFSGAYKTKIGKLEHADQGTLLLDEIGDTPMAFQTKLLRFLQEKTVEKLGDNQLKKVDVRVISSTNKNIPQLIQKKLFRQDLYYRMNAVHIELPPLRERTDDFKELLDHFVRFYSQDTRNTIKWIEQSILSYLRSYHWPGNIREFQNVIRSAVIQSSAQCLKKENFERLPSEDGFNDDSKRFNLYRYFSEKFDSNIFENSVAYLEKELIDHILQKNKYHLSNSAEELGISRVTLNAKMKKYHIAKTKA